MFKKLKEKLLRSRVSALEVRIGKLVDRINKLENKDKPPRKKKTGRKVTSKKKPVKKK